MNPPNPCNNNHPNMNNPNNNNNNILPLILSLLQSSSYQLQSWFSSIRVILVVIFSNLLSTCHFVYSQLKSKLVTNFSNPSITSTTTTTTTTTTLLSNACPNTTTSFIHSFRFLTCKILWIVWLGTSALFLNLLLLRKIQNHHGSFPSQMFIHHQNQTLLEQNSTNGHWNETSWRIQKHVFSGFSFLKGYRPPSVLEVFQPFILKDMVSVSSSSSSLKKSLEQQHLPKKVIEEFGLFENFTSTFQSSYRCIRYRLDLERKHFAHLFTTCLFENICFNRKGEWILFSKSPHAKEKSEKVWVQTNSYHALTGDIHRVRIKVLDPPSAVLVRGVNGTVPNLGNSNVMELSKNFKWIEKPTFGTSRHATSNIGHAILDNFALVFNSMINFDYVSPDSHLLFMDDMYPKIPGDTRTPELVKLHGDLATNSSLEWARRMTNLEPLQQGSNHVEGSFIKKAPCEFHGMNPIDAHAHEMDTCFSSFIVGSTGSMYSFIEGRESVITLFRKYLLRQLNVKPQKKFSKVFRIAIQNKPLHSINRDAIINVDKIVNYLRQNVTESEMLELANSVRGKHEPKYERVEIVNLKLERMSFEEQVQFFGDLDVYISTQGAASYMSLFMTKPNAVMFYVPMCFRHTLTCSDLNLKIHETWATEVKIVSLIHYTHLLECVKGNSDEEPGFKVTARVHSEPYGDCHERIDPKGLYHELISKALQRLL